MRALRVELAQRLEQELADGERAVEHDPLRWPRGRRVRLERGQHRLLELRAEAAQLAQAPGRGRLAQRLRRVDAELVEESPRSLGPEPREPGDRQQPRREALAELHRRRDLAGLDQVADLLLERRADAGELGDAPLARERGDRDGGVADDLRGVAVGEHAVDDGAVELVEVAELLERVRDLAVALGRHCTRLCPPCGGSCG